MAVRRDIRFDSLDAAVREAEHLLAVGYERAGNWSLAQVCGHLANWLTYPLDGYPKTPLPIRIALRLARATVGRRLYERIVAGWMPAGKPTMPQSVPEPGGDDAAAVGRLREAVRRFREHPGEYLPSPLYGRLTRDEAMRLQVVHAAHHLSFLVPKAR